MVKIQYLRAMVVVAKWWVVVGSFGMGYLGYYFLSTITSTKALDVKHLISAWYKKSIHSPTHFYSPLSGMVTGRKFSSMLVACIKFRKQKCRLS